MKKQFVLLAMLMLAFWACQQAPKIVIADKGPEIDNLNKTLNAYVAGDWTTYRASYSDTATIVYNTTAFSPDSLVLYHQTRRNNYDKVESSTDAVEFIQYENGDQWVHWWGKLKLTIKGTGRVVEMPVHLADRLKNGKTVEEYGYFNLLEAATAIQEATAPPPVVTK